MSYVKQNFKDGDVLHDYHLNNMETQIILNESTISNHATQINKVKQDIETLQTMEAHFYFPDMTTVCDAGSSAIMTVGMKCVLFDCGPYEENDTAIVDYYDKLKKDGVFTNIDYIVISHYHYDHVDNLEEILKKLPHDNCTAYLPMNPDGYMVENTDLTADKIKGINNRCVKVKNILNQYGVKTIIEVDTDTEVDLHPGFCKMKLFNSSKKDYTHYKDNPNKEKNYYNNYSMCALIQTGEVYSMLPGDIQITAQKWIVENRDLPRLVVYPIHHHGFENEDYPEYINMIRPEYGVISINHTRMVDGDADSMMANYATENLFSTAYGACEFVLDATGGAVLQGKEIFQCGYHNNNFNLYVDNTSTKGIYDGTEEFPFTNINECLIFINDNRQTNFTINIKYTGQTYDILWCRNLSKPIVFKGYGTGKPVINNAYIRASAYVELENLSFKVWDSSKYSRALYVSASNVNITNCEMACAESGTNTSKAGIYCDNNSHVNISNCSIHDCYDGVYASSASTVVSDSIAFKDVFRCYRLANLDLTIKGNDTFVINNSNINKSDTNYILGNSSGDGTQYKITTQTAPNDDLVNLIANNSSSVVSNPFYYNKNLCIAYGRNILKIATEAISAE